jgi:predicted RNA-binding protein with PIN domain
MRIAVVGDVHIFQGTPRQILMQMKSLAFGAEEMTMREYIEGNSRTSRAGSTSSSISWATPTTKSRSYSCSRCSVADTRDESEVSAPWRVASP